jgi:hypothetical protein
MPYDDDDSVIFVGEYPSLTSSFVNVYQNIDQTNQHLHPFGEGVQEDDEDCSTTDIDWSSLITVLIQRASCYYREQKI